LRAKLVNRWPRLRLASEDDSAAGDLGRHRRLGLHRETANRLGLAGGDLVELVGPNPAPLRGWIEIRSNAAPDSVAVDAWGHGVLGSAAGAEVTLRLLRRRQPTDLPLAGRPVEQAA
jgi:hypothetical protein